MCVCFVFNATQEKVCLQDITRLAIFLKLIHFAAADIIINRFYVSCYFILQVVFSDLGKWFLTLKKDYLLLNIVLLLNILCYAKKYFSRSFLVQCTKHNTYSPFCQEISKRLNSVIIVWPETYCNKVLISTNSACCNLCSLITISSAYSS